MEENTQPVEVMEQEAPVSAPEPSFSFVSDEEVAALNNPQSEQPAEQAEQQPAQESETRFDATTEGYQEYQPDQRDTQDSYANDLDTEVLNFLSERLGREIGSFDDLTQQQETYELDDRISAIAQFVQDTGRDPGDWFIYQQLNPSEMDDMTAIQVEMASEYPNLSQDEINTLLSSKYKLDPDVYSEEEIKVSQLQLKIDAQEARNFIEDLRDNYAAPKHENQVSESIIDEEWIGGMRQELDALEGIEFDLGNGKTFTFGLDNNYKNVLADKNARLDEFFNPYVREDGSWDYDALNMHRAVIDNVDKIMQSVYRQGMADAQRSVVQRAANASPTSPNQGRAQTGPDPLTQQLKEALMGDSGMKFFS